MLQTVHRYQTKLTRTGGSVSPYNLRGRKPIRLSSISNRTSWVPPTTYPLVIVIVVGQAFRCFFAFSVIFLSCNRTIGIVSQTGFSVIHRI